MKPTRIAMAVACGAMLGFAAMAADKPDFGKREYNSNCAVCHGNLGQGDGPYAGMMQDNRGGSDLTLLSRKNGGVFPILKVTETIDGRHLVKAHGPRDMPIWGADYQARASEQARYAESPFDIEAYVQYRIFALAEYVYRLQAK